MQKEEIEAKNQEIETRNQEMEMRNQEIETQNQKMKDKMEEEETKRKAAESALEKSAKQMALRLLEQGVEHSAIMHATGFTAKQLEVIQQALKIDKK